MICCCRWQRGAVQGNETVQCSVPHAVQRHQTHPHLRRRQHPRQDGRPRLHRILHLQGCRLRKQGYIPLKHLPPPTPYSLTSVWGVYSSQYFTAKSHDMMVFRESEKILTTYALVLFSPDFFSRIFFSENLKFLKNCSFDF